MSFFDNIWEPAHSVSKVYHSKYVYQTSHAQAAAVRPRLSETEPKLIDFETSCYAFGGRIRRLAKVNVNKTNILYDIVLIMVACCSFRCTLSLY